MRILFISTLDDYWGGSEELWVRTAQYSIIKNNSVFLGLYKNEQLHPDIKQLISKKAMTFFLKSWTQIYNSGLLTKVYYTLKKQFIPDFNYRNLLKQNIDYVCLSQANTFEAIFNDEIYNLINKINVPYIIVSQFNNEHFSISYHYIERARKIFDKAKKNIFVSQRNKEVAERQIAQKINNAIIIDNPINLNSTDYIPFPNFKTKQFASVARFDVQFKAQDLLLQVLSSEKWKQRNWVLNFYGSGKDKEYLLDLLQFYQLSQKVIFHGQVSDIRKVWESNHLLILPSIAEGKPLALEEAMICGRPAVVTDVAGNTELIKDMETGFVAKAPTPELIDEALERAWQNIENWEIMGRKAHDWTINNIDLTPEETLYKILTNK